MVQEDGRPQDGDEATTSAGTEESATGEEGRREYREAKRQRDVSDSAEVSFPSFLAGLYTQTLASLGEVENPMTGEREKDLAQAQYLIDTIGMLQKKTEGNLEGQEKQYLMNLLQDLRMRYVRAVDAAAQQGTSEQEEGSE